MVVRRAGSKSAPWVLCFLLAGSGCSYEGDLPTTNEPPPPPVSPTQAEVALSLSSSPINAVVAFESAGPWSAQWTVVVQETAGIAGEIELLRATLTDSTGAPIAETELGVDEVSAQLGSNRIEGGSNHELFMSLDFDFPGDDLSGNLRVTLQGSDDRGNSISSVADDVIQVCVPSLLAPEEAAMVDNGCTNRQNGILWEFDWSDCPSAGFYHFSLRKQGQQEPFFDRSGLTDSSFTVLENLVIREESRFGWFWMVRANLNGTWGNWSAERTFEVEPANTDCATP